MPYFPQYQNAQLVAYATYSVTVLVGATAASITAVAGSVILVEVNAFNVSAIATVTLPLVALGGPVTVKFTSTTPANAYGTAAKVTIIPVVSDTVAGCKIEGFGALTLLAIGDTVTLASDGTNWWAIDRFHNSIETW